MVAKFGFIYPYDVEGARCIGVNRRVFIMIKTILVDAKHEAAHGWIGVNKKGQSLSAQHQRR